MRMGMKQIFCLSLLLVTPCLAQPSQNEKSNMQPPSQGQQQGHDQKGPGMQPPPPESLAACKEKKNGDTCSFQGREGETIDGTCTSPETKLPLGCKPNKSPDQKK